MQSVSHFSLDHVSGNLVNNECDKTYAFAQQKKATEHGPAASLILYRYTINLRFIEIY